MYHYINKSFAKYSILVDMLCFINHKCYHLTWIVYFFFFSNPFYKFILGEKTHLPSSLGWFTIPCLNNKMLQKHLIKWRIKIQSILPNGTLIYTRKSYFDTLLHDQFGIQNGNGL